MKCKNVLTSAAIALTMLASCSQDKGCVPADTENAAENQVIKTIMSRRSIRAYKDRTVPRVTMEIIAECGINAPNGMNKQEWVMRIVDNPEFINAATEAFVKENPKMAEDPKFKNMFRNAPTLAFIAAPEGSYSGVNCGLLGENMILAAWSMGIGSCCLGGPVAFMNSEAGAEYLSRLNLPDGYVLLYAIGFGYPAENPDAKPRDKSKIKFID